MILRWLIVIGIFLAANTKPLMKKLSFDGCKEDSWRVTDISLEPDGDKIYVVADVGFDEKITNKLHQIKFTLTGCSQNYKCTNHSTPAVEEIDCLSNDGTELDTEACDVAKTLAEWELDTGDISQESKKNRTRIPTDEKKICIHYDTQLVDVDAVNKPDFQQSIQITNN